MVFPGRDAAAQGDQVARHGAVKVTSGNGGIHHRIEGLGFLVLGLRGDIGRLVEGMEMVEDRLELIFRHPRRQEHPLKVTMRHIEILPIHVRFRNNFEHREASLIRTS